MNLRRVRADATYLLKYWYRRKANVVMSFLVPLILLIGFSIIFGDTDTGAAAIALVDLDDSQASADLIATLGERATISATVHALPAGELEAFARENGAQAIVILPDGLQNVLTTPGAGNLTIATLLDDGNARTSKSISNAIEAAVGTFRDKNELDARDLPLTWTDTTLTLHTGYSAFLLPGVLGLTILSTGLSYSYRSVVQLRSVGLLSRLAVSPMTKTEWIVARIIGQTAISLAVTTVLVFVAIVLFRVPVLFDPWSIPLIIVGTMVFAGIGTAIGGAIKDLDVAGLVIQSLMFPLIIISGLFFDVSRLPDSIGWLPYISPLFYLTEGLRASLIFGDSLGAMQNTAILGSGAVALVAVGARITKWTAED